jgi:hypothetical protein
VRTILFTNRPNWRLTKQYLLLWNKGFLTEITEQIFFWISDKK